MLVLLKSKLQGQRSGNGRECNLRGKLASGDGSSAGDAKTVMTGRTVGEIAQALAWEKNSKALFGKSPGTKTTMTSVSTSPETDPGSSDLFPFFRGMLAGYCFCVCSCFTLSLQLFVPPW